ncbi:hypothetical protein QYM36_015092 [Artemia franciscana]|uniref:Reverse transcriptase domain-containing protein n=1 Tax=Artemia franciscana TaxID=6661 RepID=A0AA88HKT1_ARTSF|nr:hypothetical protein QYM36_015092 [Artemia franciscana]
MHATGDEKRQPEATDRMASLVLRNNEESLPAFPVRQVKFFFFISVNDVLRAVRHLKVNKAPDLDGTSGNHLRNGSPLLIQHMQLLFQMCIDSANVPKSFCTGIVTNILKKGKYANECGGYRPITVSGSLSKVLEKLILRKVISKPRFITYDLSLISYADDLLMLSFSLSVLQGNLDELVSGYGAIGLQVNGQKTEFLGFSSAKQETPAPTVSVDGAIIVPSSSLKYLGLWFEAFKVFSHLHY